MVREVDDKTRELTIAVRESAYVQNNLHRLIIVLLDPSVTQPSRTI